MIRLILIVSIFCSPFVSMAQTCVHHNYYSSEEREKQFPFSNTSYAVLLSFYPSNYSREEERPPAGEPESLLERLSATKWAFQKYLLSLLPDYERYEHVIEKKKLNKLQLSMLSDILFNYDYADTTQRRLTLFGCFAARNAILFYDRSDKLIARMEVCYECRGIETEPSFINKWTMSREKYGLVRKFMAEQGVWFGTRFTESDFGW